MNGKKHARISLEMIIMLCIFALLLIVLSMLKANILAALLIVSVMIVILARLGFESKVKFDGDSVEVETYKNRKNSSDPNKQDE
ncbi:hypothetical protein EZV73_10015 [Acidaminobacter sp. JC074]|uniref:hypothetical protein n=1 Tax=Acidaminobacter sp. JC074 TaxID=2530199 RepID=UPI001F0DCD48|nr:hypothetical protein [Acidaminobacter sp. JC074]MCH4887910.1 hypothetical protein [Acidaminobacter sp. JC074]